MRDSREPTETQSENGKPRFRDTLPPATGRRADGRSPRAIPTGRKACKTSAGFCTRTASNQKKKSAQSPVFPRFPHSREFLCGKKFASLRQEINFFQQRNSIFAAQKRPLKRRNASYRQFSRPFLCTDAINRVSTVPLHGRGIRGKPSFLTGNSGICRQSVTGAAGDSVPLSFYCFPVCLVCLPAWPQVSVCHARTVSNFRKGIKKESHIAVTLFLPKWCHQES